MEKGSLQPEGYMKRIADEQLSTLLDLFGAVEVAGTMWCGKTWTSLSFAESVSRIGQTAARTAAEADPETALIGKRPHVIDEWQDVPAIWDEVRDAVDREGGRPGQYILTDSCEPNKAFVHHSGAGRIAKLRMRTMTLYEQGISKGEVSLKGLFDGQFSPRLVQQKLLPLAETICRGGWPALARLSNPDAQSYLNGYFDALFDVNIPRKKLNGDDSRKVAISLARNSGRAVKMSTVAQDARFGEGGDKAAAAKASAHIAALEELYVIESVSGWDAPIRSVSRLRTKPKYYFADASLAASLLQLTPERLVTEGQLFGDLFENLCIHDLSVYASALPGAKAAPLNYYRDSDGLEVDVIIELRDGRWCAIEIKLGDNKAEEGAASLNRLVSKIRANPAARNPDPSFLAVLTGAGEYARFDKKTGVYILPLTVLGP